MLCLSFFSFRLLPLVFFLFSFGFSVFTQTLNFTSPSSNGWVFGVFPQKRSEPLFFSDSAFLNSIDKEKGLKVRFSQDTIISLSKGEVFEEKELPSFGFGFVVKMDECNSVPKFIGIFQKGILKVFMKPSDDCKKLEFKYKPNNERLKTKFSCAADSDKTVYVHFVLETGFPMKMQCVLNEKLQPLNSFPEPATPYSVFDLIGSNDYTMLLYSDENTETSGLYLSSLYFRVGGVLLSLKEEGKPERFAVATNLRRVPFEEARRSPKTLGFTFNPGSNMLWDLMVAHKDTVRSDDALLGSRIGLRSFDLSNYEYYTSCLNKISFIENRTIFNPLSSFPNKMEGVSTFQKRVYCHGLALHPTYIKTGPIKSFLTYSNPLKTGADTKSLRTVDLTLEYEFSDNGKEKVTRYLNDIYIVQFLFSEPGGTGSISNVKVYFEESNPEKAGSYNIIATKMTSSFKKNIPANFILYINQEDMLELVEPSLSFEFSSISTEISISIEKVRVSKLRKKFKKGNEVCSLEDIAWKTIKMPGISANFNLCNIGYCFGDFISSDFFFVRDVPDDESCTLVSRNQIEKKPVITETDEKIQYEYIRITELEKKEEFSFSDFQLALVGDKEAFVFENEESGQCSLHLILPTALPSNKPVQCKLVDRAKTAFNFTAELSKPTVVYYVNGGLYLQGETNGTFTELSYSFEDKTQYLVFNCENLKFVVYSFMNYQSEFPEELNCYNFGQSFLKDYSIISNISLSFLHNSESLF